MQSSHITRGPVAKPRISVLDWSPVVELFTQGVVRLVLRCPIRYMEVLHLFSGPDRAGDLSHWFKILAGKEGIVANVVNVDSLV